MSQIGPIKGPTLSLADYLCPVLVIYEDIRLVVARVHMRAKLTRRGGLRGETRVQSEKTLPEHIMLAPGSSCA